MDGKFIHCKFEVVKLLTIEFKSNIKEVDEKI